MKAPRHTCRSTVRRDRPKVGLLIQSSLEYGRGLLRGIGAYVRRHGPWAIFHRAGAMAESLPAELRRWKPQGIIAQLESPKLIRQVMRLRVPTIDLLTVHERPGIPRIGVDNEAVSRLVVDYFIERGYEHFAYCGFEGVFYCEERGRTYVDYLRPKGHTPAVYNTPRPKDMSGVFGIEAAGQLDLRRIGAWIEGLPKPLALMAGSDIRAQQVLSACSERGISVPDQVAVAGVGNDEVLCNLCDPLLTSVALKTEQIGYTASALLHRMMDGAEPEPMLSLFGPVGMVERESTNKLAITDPDVARAVQFIREHVCEGISVKDVADHVILSRSTLQRRFRAILGRTPRQEIIRAQIHRVKSLLAEKDISLARVAEMTGFRHVECMSRLFKQKTGLTPGQYREQVRLQA